MKQEADKIKTENNDLQQKNQYFSTPEFQEKTAKEKLDLQKQDENVVIVKSSPSSITSGESNQRTTAEQSNSPDLPNYKKWWNLFFAYKD